MAKKPSPPAGPGPTAVPDVQLDLPVGFDPAGHPVTLRQAMDPDRGKVAPPDALTAAQRADLTVRRIEAQPGYALELLGAGSVDRARAVREIQANTKVGRMLVDIELRVVRHLLAEVVAR